jgi:hypothetical protein
LVIGFLLALCAARLSYLIYAILSLSRKSKARVREKCVFTKKKEILFVISVPYQLALNKLLSERSWLKA